MAASEANENSPATPEEPTGGSGPEVAGHETAAQPAAGLEPGGERGQDTGEQPTIEMLRTQLEQANDRVLRAQAELENVRKRTRRELDEHRQYANLPLVADLLPAFDNLDRAVEAAEKNENATGLLEGVKMVTVQIQSILEQYGCRRLHATGAAFDPNLHEAVAQEPSAELPAGQITRELRVGYQLHDRIIRPAQVMVSTGPAAPSDSE